MMVPESEAALADIVAGASGPLRVLGGGTRGMVCDGVALSVAGVSGIELYEPGALTLVVRAGTSVAEVERVLAAEGQRLAFEPMDHRGLLGTDGGATMGGVVAGNLSGPRRIQSGACRDFLLGVRFVDGMGQVVQNGGRVMKNVTGYDLVKLMAGSWGTLGVLTELSFKVLPRPEAAATLRIHGLDDQAAIAVLGRALGSPFEVSGAAHLPEVAQTLLRTEGFGAQVTYRVARLRDLLADCGGEIEIEDDPDQVATDWRDLRDVELMHGSDGDVWRFSVKPSDAPALVAGLRATHPVRAVQYDWGGGLVWIEVDPGHDIRPDGLAGHATLIRADAQTRSRVPVFQPEAPGVAALSAALRQKFDPRGILNPGLMG